MTTTPVGMRCPECSRERTKVMRMRDMASVPRVTYALIAINVAVFLAEGGGAFAISGGRGPSGTVFTEGALLGSLPGVPELGVAHGQWWRIITGGFLHESLLHIAFNMYILYILGRMLEPVLGRVKFGVIYGVSLLTGSLGALLVSPHSVTVGASGAVFGIMGAAAVEMRARKIPLMQSGVGGLILINLVISFTLSGISWGGHVGGLAGGALAAFLLQQGEQRRAQALAFAACAVIAVAAAAGSIATSKASEEASVPAQLAEPGQ
ncbi:MAG: rhomboid family intramembrane serine protease [Solirubrobacterales bacterium]